MASQVRQLRQQRSWSIRQLAEECAKAGAVSLTANALENIERGRAGGDRGARNVSVDELVALAFVLDVSPTELLVPSRWEVGATYLVTSGRVEDPLIVRAWMDMRVPLDDVVRVWKRMQADDEFGRECRRVWFDDQHAYQQLVDLVRRVRAEDVDSESAPN
ncbi:MAG: helix-turn-helix transcriptional regulator [Umezawaea sp.]